VTGFHPQMPALRCSHCSERTATIEYDDADPICQPGPHSMTSRRDAHQPFATGRSVVVAWSRSVAILLMQRHPGSADTGHLPKCVLSLEIRMICSGTHDLILESYWV
jgi:hypothetical protein